MAIDLTVASLDELHHHRREKWSMHPPDVLSSTIAEMDFPIAEPVAQALRAAIDHGVWVLADEIHAPLTLPGAIFTAWLEVSDAAREIGVSLTSASKAFNVAGLKSALVVTASEHSRDLVAAVGAQHDHSGLLGAIAAEAAFTDGDPWFDAVLTQLDATVPG